MRILITNNTLDGRAGSELYVRDLAIALMKRGHQPIAYSTQLGEVAEELRRATIPVISDLHALSTPPDIIHGQHHLDAVTAMLHFPLVPALYICHGWLPWEEHPPVLPGIRRYVAVDDLCRERLATTSGIDPESIEVLYNFADMQRFQLRAPLPAAPRSALVFSNYANGEASIAPIRNACLRAGIEQVDIIGSGMGKSAAEPAQLLGQYDLVFAKARAAIEAMASGCAVIVADQVGLASMVDTQNVAALRNLNFGVRTMQRERLTEEAVFREIQRYDADDARQVSLWIRQEADMERTVDRWQDIYSEVLSEAEGILPLEHLHAQLRAGADYLRWLSPIIKGRQHFEVETRAYVEQLEAARLQMEEQLTQQAQALQHHQETSARQTLALQQHDEQYARQVEALRSHEERSASQALMLQRHEEQSADHVAALQQYEDQLAEQAHAFQRCQEKSARQTFALQQSEQHSTHLEDELRLQTDKLHQLQGQLAAVHRSRSWRMLGCYRRLMQWLGRS